MTHERAVVAYRYHVIDIDRWPDDVVLVFYNNLRAKESV